MNKSVPTGAAFLHALGSASRTLNRAIGGRPGESLCGRMTRTRSHDCLFCRLVGWVLRDAEHCWRQRIYELRQAGQRWAAATKATTTKK